ncbi:glycosyltransferase family 4 protein [Pseudidiomarina sp. PP-1MA]|uniref:Glycosyltransferase family 4 protein n=1 Tax=Pseudidiomarina sp. PP-1MA TaxID=3237706 RepID=A0AB39X9Z5_9GAMM
MKVLYIVTPAKYFLSHRIELANYVHRHGFEVILLSKMAGNERALFSNLCFPLKTFDVDLTRNPQAILKEISVILRLKNLVKKIKPDIIHCSSHKGCIFGGLAARFLRIPCVLAPGGLATPFRMEGIRYRIIRIFIYSVFNYLLAGDNFHSILQNRYELTRLISKRNRHKVSLIRGAGVNTCGFLSNPPQKNKHDSIVRILYLGRIIKSKGIVEYLKAASDISSNNSNVEFLLAGELDSSSLDRIEPHELQHHLAPRSVTWLGAVRDVRGLLSTVDIVCLPSYTEGLPQCLVEAASAGLPLVGCDIPGIREVIIDGVNGLLCKPKDVKSLSFALSRLVNDESIRKLMGAQSLLMSKQFDIENVGSSTIDLYRKLIGVSSRHEIF